MPTNLAAVLAIIEAAVEPTRKEVEMAAAVRGVGKVLGRELKDISAPPELLSKLLAEAKPMSVGMGAQRWGRVKTLLRAALVRAGFEVMPARDIGGLSPAWAALAIQLDRRLRNGLSRFMSFCSRRGIAPENVDEGTFAAFEAALMNASLQSWPARIYRATLRHWSQAREAHSDWPRQTVELTPDARRYALDKSRFTVSFRDDVEAWLAQAAESNPFAKGYRRPLRPPTVRAHRIHIYQVATALIASGFPAEKLTSLAALVELPNAEAALRYLRKRHEDREIPQVAGQAATLCAIARRWVKSPEAQLSTLREFAANLRPKQRGMTPRSRERLRQFDVRANVAAVLGLPARVLWEIQHESGVGREGALRVMLALAVEILTVAPMRMQNLAGLDIERHLKFIRRGGEESLHIAIPAAETKTREPYEMVLPESAVHLLAAYLKTFRCQVAEDPGPFLFPGRKGSRPPSSFGHAISKFILRETGLVMHPHLFRHFGVKLHLEYNPEAIETMRQVLGHRSIQTTLKAYADLSTALAFRRYDETIAKRRRETDPLYPNPVTRRRGGPRK